MRVAQRDYARAIEWSARALAIREEAGDSEEAAALVATLAHTYLAAGDDVRALQGFERVVQVTRNQRRASAALYHAGRVHAARGRPDASLDTYGRSLALRESLQDWAGAAEALTGIAEVRRERGEVVEALADVRRAINLARRARALEQLAPAQEAAARCLQQLGQSAEARRASGEAAETAARIQTRDASRVAGETGRSQKPALDALRHEVISLHAQMAAERARIRPDESRLADLDGRLDLAAREIARLGAAR